jgi:hypothetical protein
VKLDRARHDAGDFRPREPAFTLTSVQIAVHPRRIPSKHILLFVPCERTLCRCCMRNDRITLGFELD